MAPASGARSQSDLRDQAEPTNLRLLPTAFDLEAFAPPRHSTRTPESTNQPLSAVHRIRRYIPIDAVETSVEVFYGLDEPVNEHLPFR